MHPGRSRRQKGSALCRWACIVATLGILNVVTIRKINLHSHHGPSSAIRSLQSSRSESLSRRRSNLQWPPPQKRATACTDDLHSLIDQQELDWTQKRSLPEFLVRDDDKGGGVIVFWHLAKTGGTTVRKQCASLPGVDYLLLLSPSDYYGGSQLIEDRLTPSANTEEIDAYNHSRKHTLFVELHGVLSPPTVLEMESRVERWRSLSRQHGTPLFIFTIFREPTSHSLSFYNFFHKDLSYAPLQGDLSRKAFNRQCHTLAAPGHNKNVCAMLYNKLYQLFDWVGITERLTKETLPLLQHLLRYKQAQQKFASIHEESFVLPTNLSRTHYNEAIVGKNTIHREELSSETLQTLKEKTCLDRGLWERVQREYTLEIFRDSIDGHPSRLVS